MTPRNLLHLEHFTKFRLAEINLKYSRHSLNDTILGASKLCHYGNVREILWRSLSETIKHKFNRICDVTENDDNQVKPHIILQW